MLWHLLYPGACTPTPAHSPRSGTCFILALALRHPRTRHALALALSWRRHSDTLCHSHWRLHSVTRAGARTLALALASRPALRHPRTRHALALRIFSGARAPTPWRLPRSDTRAGACTLTLALRRRSPGSGTDALTTRSRPPTPSVRVPNGSRPPPRDQPRVPRPAAGHSQRLGEKTAKSCPPRQTF